MQQNDEEVAQYLLEDGAEMNARTRNKLASLQMATQNGNVPGIQ